jgi:hypothetical protein
VAGVWISRRLFVTGCQYCRPYSKEEANVRLLLLSRRLFLLNKVKFYIGVVTLCRNSDLVQENSPLFARKNLNIICCK